MRGLLHISSIVVIAGASTLNAQIRTPIATVSDPTTTPGPAPYNAKAVATSPTSVAVSWDAVSGARAYTVDRTRTDDPACCVAHSGLITATSWNDGSLEATKEYSFVITALYFDGRVGSTEVVVATPAVALPSVRLPKDFQLLSSAEGILRYTACGQKSSGGPGPASITQYTGSPAGARFTFPPVGSGVNYVVDRAPEGTTSWTLVGSTCGGPSPIVITPEYVSVQDYAGGVTIGAKYVYRVYAVASNGAAGWNTTHFQAPCRIAPLPQASVAGSTVTLTWDDGMDCNLTLPSAKPDTYTLSTSFGYTKTAKNYHWNKEVLYGVPLGTHTVTMAGNYRTGGSATPSTMTFTVAY